MHNKMLNSIDFYCHGFLITYKLKNISILNHEISDNLKIVSYSIAEVTKYLKYYNYRHIVPVVHSKDISKQLCLNNNNSSSLNFEHMNI